MLSRKYFVVASARSWRRTEQVEKQVRRDTDQLEGEEGDRQIVGRSHEVGAGNDEQQRGVILAGVLLGDLVEREQTIPIPGEQPKPAAEVAEVVGSEQRGDVGVRVRRIPVSIKMAVSSIKVR